MTQDGLTNSKNGVILYPRHSQVFDHAFNFRIADIGPVDMADQVQQGQHGDQTGVHLLWLAIISLYMDMEVSHLPKDLLPPFCRKIGIKVLIVRRQTNHSKGSYLSNVGALGDALDVRGLVDNLDVFLGDGSSHSCPRWFN